MKGVLKRLFACLLAAVMVTGSAPGGGMTVYAEETQGSGIYTAEHPCELPSESGADHALRVEAEDFILDSTNAALDGQGNKKYIRINENANASGGKQIGWFETGNLPH